MMLEATKQGLHYTSNYIKWAYLCLIVKYLTLFQQKH